MKEAEEKTVTKVTAEITIDFTSLNWSINKGEVRKLPVDADAQKIILQNENITIVTEEKE